MPEEMDDIDPKEAFETVQKLLKHMNTPSSPLELTKLVSGINVSTVDTKTDKFYETAICDSVGCHPVERYSSKEAALSGHDKWVTFAKDLKQGSQITEIGIYVIPDKTITIVIQHDSSLN